MASVSSQVHFEHWLLRPVTEHVPNASQPLHQLLLVSCCGDPSVCPHLGGTALPQTEGLPPHYLAPGRSITAPHPTGARRYSCKAILGLPKEGPKPATALKITDDT